MQPPGVGNRLPEVYCIVSDLGAFSLYGQLLESVEEKRAISVEHAEDLLRAALKTPLPAPGKEAWIRAMVSSRVGRPGSAP